MIDKDREPRPPVSRTIRFELDPRSLGLTLLAVAAVWLLFKLWPVLVLMTVALVVVGTLHPVVEWMERRGIRRGIALAMIFIGMLLGFVGLVFITIPPLVSQLAAMLENAPANQAKLVAWLDQYAVTTAFADSLRDSNMNEVFGSARDSLLDYSTQVLTVIGYGVTMIFLAFYLLADGKRAQGAIYAVVPRHYHLRLSRIILNLETIVGGYMRGQMITSAAITLFTFTLLMLCGVPNALSLAVLAGFADLIPFIGGLLATAPAVLVALTRGTGTAIVVGVVLFIYQEFESRILVPGVYGRVLRLSPAAVLLALLIGGTLLGIIGALLALPIAAGLQMIARELRVEMPGDDTHDQSLIERDQAAEALYEQRSAGAPAAEAGVIATELAKEIRAEDAAEGLEATDVPITSGEPEPEPPPDADPA